jgi:hypothetical protein
MRQCLQRNAEIWMGSGQSSRVVDPLAPEVTTYAACKLRALTLA